MARRRLDAELVRRGLVATRSEAQSAVRNGLVLVSGRSASKPSRSSVVAGSVTMDIGDSFQFSVFSFQERRKNYFGICILGLVQLATDEHG